jgi:vacuolar-type H+-ATPase subunit H
MTREIRVDDHIAGFINQVRQYALSAQQGDALAMAKVNQTLEKLSNDTSQAFTRLSERMTTIEKAATAISSSTNTTISSTQAAAN